LEKTWVELQPWLSPLNVEVEGEGDAEVAVVDLENVVDVDFNQDLVRPSEVKTLLVSN